MCDQQAPSRLRSRYSVLRILPKALRAVNWSSAPEGFIKQQQIGLMELSCAPKVDRVQNIPRTTAKDSDGKIPEGTLPVLTKRWDGRSRI